jgi:hypothetical protein
MVESVRLHSYGLKSALEGDVMDPVSLATAAVALLGPYLAQAGGGFATRTGETIAEGALPKVKALYERLQARLAPGSYQRALLDGVKAEPDNPDRQDILKAELAKLLAQEKRFAVELEGLVEEADRAGGMRITATDAGVVAGRDASLRGRYVAGRDMRVGYPTREAQDKGSGDPLGS